MTARAFMILVLCGMTSMLCKFSPAMKGGDEAGVLAELPMVVGDFVGESESPSDKELELLPSDTIIVKRVYRTPGRRIENRDLAHVSLVIAGNDSRSIHRPEVCLDGQGWTVTHSSVREVKLLSGQVLQVRDLAIVREVLMSNGTKLPLRAHYIYWFVGDDVTTPSNLERQILSFSDNILHNINHRWAYPSVMAWVTEGMPPEKAGQRIRTDEETITMLLNLVRTMAPKFQKNLMPHS